MKKLLLFFALLLIFCLLPLSARAAEEQTPEDQALGAIPEEFKELFLRDGGLSMPDFGQFFETLGEAIGEQVKASGADLALFFGSILLCSIFTLFQKTIAKNASGALRLSLLLCGCLSVFGAFAGAAGVAQKHLTALVRLLGAYVPAVTAAAAAMGGVTSAALSGAALGMILSFIGQFTLGVLMPMLRVTLALDFASEMTGQKGLFSFAKGMRSLFITVLGIVSALLSGVFALQNVIAAKTDSLSLRAFRFTVGSAIPLVGSVISESSKTLLAGLSLMRSTIGAVGVILILLLFLPTLLLLICSRLVLKISASFSSSLDASPLSELFEAGASAAGGLIAVVSISDLCAVTALCSTMYTAV